MQASLGQMLLDLDESAAIERVRADLAAGRDSVELIEECRRAITQLGERYGRGEAYLSELIIAAGIFEDCVATLEPRIRVEQSTEALGTIVLGTVQGDIHDLGKDIVATLFRCGGFNVVDLGVDVPPVRFAEAVAEAGASIVGMSCLLTTSYSAMKATVKALVDAGLRERTYVVVGGGPIDERVREHVGADFCAVDAVRGVSACRAYIQSHRNGNSVVPRARAGAAA